MAFEKNKPKITAAAVFDMELAKQALEYKIAGMQIREIATRVKKSHTWVVKACDRLLREIPRSAANELREIENERLEKLRLNTVLIYDSVFRDYQKACKPDLTGKPDQDALIEATAELKKQSAASRLVKLSRELRSISGRRCRLNGLDAPKEINLDVRVNRDRRFADAILKDRSLATEYLSLLQRCRLSVSNSSGPGGNGSNGHDGPGVGNGSSPGGADLVPDGRGCWAVQAPDGDDAAEAREDDADVGGVPGVDDGEVPGDEDNPGVL